MVWTALNNVVEPWATTTIDFNPLFIMFLTNLRFSRLSTTTSPVVTYYLPTLHQPNRCIQFYVFPRSPPVSLLFDRFINCQSRLSSEIGASYGLSLKLYDALQFLSPLFPFPFQSIKFLISESVDSRISAPDNIINSNLKEYKIHL